MEEWKHAADGYGKKNIFELILQKEYEQTRHVTAMRENNDEERLLFGSLLTKSQRLWQADGEESSVN